MLHTHAKTEEGYKPGVVNFFCFSVLRRVLT